jgi:hypothetical protein
VGGIAIAFVLAGALDAAPSAVADRALGAAMSVLSGATALAVVAALPTAMAAAARDPVADLQEG